MRTGAVLGGGEEDEEAADRPRALFDRRNEGFADPLLGVPLVDDDRAQLRHRVIVDERNAHVDRRQADHFIASHCDYGVIASRRRETGEAADHVEFGACVSELLEEGSEGGGVLGCRVTNLNVRV
jgi:hypothetical protein